MGTNARDLLNRAYTILGVRASGETLDPDTMQDGLVALNGLVSTLRTQSLVVTSVDRQVFPLTANRQTYTIGTGGDFDVPRPQTITGAALLLNGLNFARSVTITRVGTIGTVALTAHGFTVGQSILIDGATDIAYDGIVTVTAIPTVNTFTYDVFGAPLSPALGTITAASFTLNAVEVPRPVITDDAYQALAIKTLASAQFTGVYYNQTYPLGTIYLYPEPNTAGNQLVLYLQNIFSGFESLTKDYDWPSIAGYEEMLVYNAALRLGRPNGRPAPDDVVSLAKMTLGFVKRANYKMSDLATDLALTRDARYGYNIVSGSGGSN